MLKVVSGGLWDTIKRLAKRRAQCSAAVAYVSTDDWLSFREGDLLVTDASDRAIAEGLTSAAVLSRAHRRGVMLYSLGGLHAKVLVLGRTAVVGSANLSRSSRSLTEAAVVSDDATMVAMAKSFVHRLTDYARPIDARFLARISNIPVERGPRPGGRGPQVKLPTPRAWLVSLLPLSDRIMEAETEWVEAGVSAAEERLIDQENEVEQIRLWGNSRFRREAKDGDSVVMIWRLRKTGPVDRVYRPQIIRYRQDAKKWTRFYLESPRDAEDTTLAWRAFKSLATRAGFRKPTSSSTREIPEDAFAALTSLWESA